MEKKKNFIIWLLVIVIIVLLALVFVLYKDKNKVSDNTVNEEDNIENQIEEVTTLDINSSEVQELEKIYDLIFTSTCAIFLLKNYLMMVITFLKIFLIMLL